MKIGQGAASQGGILNFEFSKVPILVRATEKVPNSSEESRRLVEVDAMIRQTLNG
jgi:hypothetical protein